MQLESITYSQFEGELEEWSIKDFSFSNVNLIVEAQLKTPGGVLKKSPSRTFAVNFSPGHFPIMFSCPIC